MFIHQAAILLFQLIHLITVKFWKGQNYTLRVLECSLQFSSLACLKVFDNSWYLRVSSVTCASRSSLYACQSRFNCSTTKLLYNPYSGKYLERDVFRDFFHWELALAALVGVIVSKEQMLLKLSLFAVLVSAFQLKDSLSKIWKTASKKAIFLILHYSYIRILMTTGWIAFRYKTQINRKKRQLKETVLKFYLHQ